MVGVLSPDTGLAVFQRAFALCVSDKLDITINLVRVKGLEPLRLMATDFESVVTTNSTIPALLVLPV